VRLKYVEKTKGQLARVPAEAGVERGLAATGLRLGELNLDPEALQHAHHRLAHGGVKRIHDAGYEELGAARRLGHGMIILPGREKRRAATRDGLQVR
jgi:hypothetical protein